LSDDQIRSDSRGIIRIAGSPEPVNGRNVGEVCLTIDAYTLPEDRAPFEAVQLDGRGCDNSSNLSLPERKVNARNTALRNGLEGYNPAARQLKWNVLSRLPKGVIEEGEEIRTDSNSLCVDLTFSVIPIEVDLATRDVGPLSTEDEDKDGFIFVRAGLFRMGSEKSADEMPVHDVYLDAFRISETPVTNAQYDQCVNAFACSLPSNLDRYRDPTYQDHPVSGVTWEQAAAYAQWVGGRLPTEAEWEKTCTGPSNWTYPWGHEPRDSKWVNFNRHVGDTTPVDAYRNGASPYGALDMAGNVWEWIGDWYAEDYYVEAPRDNPTGPESGTARVLRGGSYRSNLDGGLRCADRFAIDPAQKTNHIGFRVVISDREEVSDQ
jgi:formylglycine-generating enzyme required for sulfatase activity